MSDNEPGQQPRIRAATPADDAWLRLVAEDLAPLLGPGVEIVELSLEGSGPFVLACRYRFRSTERTTLVTAATLLEAHADLRGRLAEDRVGMALAALVATS